MALWSWSQAGAGVLRFGPALCLWFRSLQGPTIVRRIVAAALAAADAWISRALAEESMGDQEVVSTRGKRRRSPTRLERLRAQVAALERAAQSVAAPVCMGDVVLALFPEGAGTGQGFVEEIWTGSARQPKDSCA